MQCKHSAEMLELLPSSGDHSFNWHRGRRRRQVNAGQLTQSWVDAHMCDLGPEIQYIIGRSGGGHITSNFCFENYYSFK